MVYDDSGAPPRQDMPRAAYSNAAPVPPPTPDHYRLIELAIKGLRSPSLQRVLASVDLQARRNQLRVSVGMVEYVLQVLNPPSR